jgi:hypothetical protein
MKGSCENGTETSEFIKGRALGQVSDVSFLKKGLCSMELIMKRWKIKASINMQFTPNKIC